MDPTEHVSLCLGPDALLENLRSHAFSPGGKTERVGVEVELIPVDADTGRRLSIEAGDTGLGSLAWLERHGAALGWHPSPYASVAPAFFVPGGGTVSFEPGGQIEYATPPLESVDAVIERLDAVMNPLIGAGGDEGIRFLARGFDPESHASAARPQLRAARYTRMCAHYDRLGPWGRRMMCHSAALHVNLDWGSSPADRWRAANAAASVWTAIFANSTKEQGRNSGHRSVRALQWRHLDPGRCGVVDGPGEDPASAYLRFALRAPAFLVGSADAPAEPLEEWVARGRVDDEVWALHLTTLFPEVRPRGYLELRSFDALKPRWYAAPLVLATGLLYDREALRTALDLLPSPSPEALERAGRVGVHDSRMATLATELATVALEGASRLGPKVGGRSLEIARAFVGEFTARGRDPADEPGDHA